MSREDHTGAIHPELCYPIDKAARFMGLSIRDLREAVNSNEIKAAKLKRSCIMIPGWSLIRWIEENIE